MVKRIFGLAALFIGGAAVVALIVIALTGPQRVWTTLFGDADLGPAHFTKLVRADTPNEYLVCPQDFCTLTVPDRISKAYPVDQERLLAALKEIVEERENVQLVADPEPDDLRFIERSKLFRFPDTISITVLDGGNGSSLVAVFSRSQIGRYDMGTNARRVEALLDDLEVRLARANAG
ncbi:MAG: DUF1499 domain-containing protein [Pseudomonadota bacterium]